MCQSLYPDNPPDVSIQIHIRFIPTSTGGDTSISGESVERGRRPESSAPDQGLDSNPMWREEPIAERAMCRSLQRRIDFLRSTVSTTTMATTGTISVTRAGTRCRRLPRHSSIRPPSRTPHDRRRTSKYVRHGGRSSVERVFRERSDELRRPRRVSVRSRRPDIPIRSFDPSPVGTTVLNNYDRHSVRNLRNSFFDAYLRRSNGRKRRRAGSSIGSRSLQ